MDVKDHMEFNLYAQHMQQFNINWFRLFIYFGERFKIDLSSVNRFQKDLTWLTLSLARSTDIILNEILIGCSLKFKNYHWKPLKYSNWLVSMTQMDGTRLKCLLGSSRAIFEMRSYWYQFSSRERNKKKQQNTSSHVKWIRWW